MENVKSKRRPVPQKDDVDVALEKMGHTWKYNPIRQNWWKYLVLFLVIFMIISFLAPSWSASGPSGVAQILVQLAVQLLISATFAIFFIYIQFFAIARPRTYWLKPYETGITFNDYKGNPQVLEMAREVVLLLKGSKDFQQMGGEYIRGLLLEGDPGTGKSYLAQAIASEAGVPFGYCSSPSLQSPFLAGGMLSIKSLYRKARKLANQYGACILFLDEIDAIGQKRNGSSQDGGMGMGMGGMMGGGNLLINELLVQLDPPPVDERFTTKFWRWLGLDFKRVKAERPPVLTIGATNLVSTLDDALKRPGRFDRIITVDKPDSEGRREIIEYYLDRVNHENIPIDRLIDETMGYSPVEIKGVINEAVVRAHFNGRDAITYPDLLEARSIREVGLRQPIRGMKREEKRRLAYHETGHAVAQALLVPWERIVKLTIIRHGSAYGFMQPKPLEEKHIFLKEELEVDIQVSLASRASEELFLGSGSNGFYGDLASATARAVHLIGDIGLNGHLSSRVVLQIPGAQMQIEVENYLEEQMKKVRQLLEANSDMVHALAAELLEREELLGDEVMEIINQFPAHLTNDAKNKRKKMGFRREAAGEAGSGMWSSSESVPLAPTGTDGSTMNVPAAYTQANSAPAAKAESAAYRVVSDAPSVSMPSQSFTPTPSYTSPSNTGFYAATPAPMPVSQPIVQPEPPMQVQQAQPIEYRPVQQVPQPTPPSPIRPVTQDDDDDDMLPRSW